MIRNFLTLATGMLVAAFCFAQHLGDTTSYWSGVVELPDKVRLEFSVALQSASGTISIPLQGAKEVPLDDVQVTDQAIHFAIAQAGAVWELQVAEDGQTAQGVLKQGAEYNTTMKRLPGGDAVPVLKRPQEPHAPFPYASAEVQFNNAQAGITLAGTLTSPVGDGPFACVILVTGSGPQDRNESLMGHHPFLVLADHLTRAGFAVLRYDDRGVGQSKGDFSTATTDDFASDALAAVAYLRTDPKIDGQRIGILGHSEGGIIAPMCAAQSPDVAFIVMLAGTGIPGAELIPLQSKLISVADGAPLEEAEGQAQSSAQALQMVAKGAPQSEVREVVLRLLLEEIAADPTNAQLKPEAREALAKPLVEEQLAGLYSPWLHRFLGLDPKEALGKVHCPVLALGGSKDLQVPPAANFPAIQAALFAAGNSDFTLTVLPNLNHLFQTCGTGSPTEYGTIEETFAPVALDAITGWLRMHAGTPQ
ncbi:MAG: alpha/beta fold hydrolase [Planctomycetes bacterium]|nr:alpha/beta fold hydrolase [Planctomycetota bacterium]MCB9910161.1 alpha/beta fold hydrolase [Planctomycetota bacterium]HPF15569.1 alpha/beta fold hydrolase [Planctomycetota bacterium]